MLLSDFSIHAWIHENNILTESGLPIDFNQHFYLFDIYSDFSPRLVCMKAAQIGFTTAAIIKSFFVADKMKLDGIYTLPTASDIRDFVGGKVNRIVAQSPYLQGLVADKDSIEQKQIGRNIIYYRGTFTEKAAIMVSSDLNIYDEEDRSKQDVIQQYASRLQHSKHKWEWHFSNPSVEGNGVSRYWPLSDQKHWFVKCKACNIEDYLDFPDSVDMEKRIYICKNCGAPLSDNDRRIGRWVKKFRDREFSGYWIPLLIAPWVSANEVIKYHETKSKEYFANFVMGIPYVGEGNVVTPDTIYRNITAGVNNQKDVVIGCDSGIVKHYVIGNRQGLFYYGKTESWDDIDGFLKRFDRSIAVIDAMPDITGPRKLREKYPGRVILCHYARDRKTMSFVRFGEGSESGNVLVDRNRMMQLVIDEFADRRIPIFGSRDDWSEYVSHWKTLYRVTVDDALGVPQFEWKTSNGMDHWAHATVYWRTGMERQNAGGGAILSSESVSFPSAPSVSHSGTMRAPDPKKVFQYPQEEDDWRRV